jgi:hypothetical protein
MGIHPVKATSYYLTLLLYLIGTMAIVTAVWGKPWQKASVAAWLAAP